MRYPEQDATLCTQGYPARLFQCENARLNDAEVQAFLKDDGCKSPGIDPNPDYPYTFSCCQ